MSILNRFFLTLVYFHIVCAFVVNSGLSLSTSNNVTGQTTYLPESLSSDHRLDGPWDPRCYLITSPPIPKSLDYLNCKVAAEFICLHLSLRKPAQLQRRQWYWYELPRCAIGYYLPKDAWIPERLTCEAVVKDILEKCGGHPNINAGAVNVKTLPGSAQSGNPEDPRYAVFLMASKKLTS